MRAAILKLISAFVLMAIALSLLVPALAISSIMLPQWLENLSASDDSYSLILQGSIVHAGSLSLTGWRLTVCVISFWIGGVASFFAAGWLLTSCSRKPL